MSLLRTAAAIGTGGLSEVIPLVAKAIKPKKIAAPPTSGAGSATYGTTDNPDWLAWKARKDDLDQQIKADPGWGNDPNGGQRELAQLGPEPPRTVQVNTVQDAYANTQASGAANTAAVNAQVARINGIANQFANTANPVPTNQQLVANAQANGVTRGAPVTNQFASATPTQIQNFAKPSATPLPASTFTFKPDTSAVGAGTPNYAAMGADAAGRAAPQIQESGAGLAAQQQALSGAQSFQPNTSGVAGIRGATADTSGAAALSGFTPDAQGINKLDAFRPTNAQGGIDQLNSFNADKSGINTLNDFRPTNANEGIQNLNNFDSLNTRTGVEQLQQFAPEASTQAAQGLLNYRPNEALQAAAELRTFRPDQGVNAASGLQNLEQNNANIGTLNAFQGSQSGINALNSYAGEAQGPSAAQALLQSQSDKDVRTAIALARSARGGPAAIAQAQRQAQSEGAAIQAETRGQAATLSAQEYDTYKQRQLAALSNAGSLIGQSEGQRLSAMQAAGQLISDKNAQLLQAKVAAGQLLSNADAQKLAAYQSVAQAETAAGAQRLSAQQSGAQILSAGDAQMLQARVAAGQLLSQADAQRLSAFQAATQAQTQQDAQLLQAKVASGQLLSQAEGQRLSAYQSATQAQTAQDQQLLGAATAAGQLRSQADATRQTALANSANILLQGSQINQQGQIAATNAELQGSAQQLQSLSLQGQISNEIRTADIDVLKSNLSASLQQLNLNDTQVRSFAQMGEDARQANQSAQLQAQQLGLNGASVAAAVDLQWQQFAQQQLTEQQQIDLAKQGIQVNIASSNADRSAAFTNNLINLAGAGTTAAGKASDERAKKGFRPVKGETIAKALRDSPASDYEYTEPDKPGRAPGRHIGPMAQGLRKSTLFAPAVSPAKDGTLMVDTGRLALAHHAALSHLQKEIDQIKKHRKGRREARA